MIQPIRPYSASEAPLKRQPEPAVGLEPAALDLERDVAAEQVERAVRHVDHAHQAEDQREPARDHEVQRRQRQAVERDRGEDAQVLGRLDRQEAGHEDGQRRQRDALGRPVGRRPRVDGLRAHGATVSRARVNSGRRTSSPPLSADSCAHRPTQVQLAERRAFGNGSRCVGEGADELVHEVRVRAAVAGALREAQVRLLVVVDALGREALDLLRQALRRSPGRRSRPGSRAPGAWPCAARACSPSISVHSKACLEP